MTDYLPVSNAPERSRLEAMQRGAGLQQGATTLYWHSWITHPLSGEQALVVTDEIDKEFFTAEELVALLTQEQAEAADWFVDFEELS